MQTRFDTQLSALAQANSLAKMYRDAGLDQSIASMLRDVNALSIHGGLEKMRRETASVLEPRDYLMREAKKMARTLADAEQIRSTHAGLFVDAFGDMEPYRKMVSDAMGPLSALRSVSLYESEVARLARQPGGLLGAGVKDFTASLSASEQIRKQQEQLAATFGEGLADRWLSSARDIAEQFTSAKDILEKQAKAWRNATAFDPAQLARGLGIPVMDPAAFAAITRSTGVEGLLAQLRAFGIDESTLRTVASAVAEDEQVAAELLRASGEADARPRAKLTRAQLIRLWNVAFILFSVLFPIYTWWDSNQAEARITGEIRSSEARTSAEIKASEARENEKLEAMAKLMERVVEIAEQEVLAEQSMVVRERVATIRADPRHGARVVAEVFPNQVVTLLEERGKWIRVEYYDWLAGEERDGWALKKYFARVEPIRGPNPQNRIGAARVRPVDRRDYRAR